MEHRTTFRTYNWIGRHIRIVAAGALVLVMALGVIGPLVADTAEPNFDPKGELFDVAERAALTLKGESTIEAASFLVEARDGGNVLTADALGEWLTASDTVRSNPVNGALVGEQFNPDTGAPTPSVWSIADAVDTAMEGELSGATDTEITAAIDRLLAQDSPASAMRFTLAESSQRSPLGWESPAFITQVVFDSSEFPSQAAQELWLRDVQNQFRVGAVHTDSIGIAIDGDTAFGEAAEQSAPFIFLAVALIILLILFVHRSYWSAVVVAAGLGATTLAYYGTASLIGLHMGSLLLAFIVPIAMISFGVDFYIHGLGRVREMQVEENMSNRRAYPAGLSAVFTAMLLAVASSVAAFLANAASGTESIIEFGIGAAISLVWAYLLLGQLAPRVTVGLERTVGRNPKKGASKYIYGVATLVMAVFGGLTVALSAVMPTIGTIALIAFLSLAVGLPVLAARRRNRRAGHAGRELVREHRGAGHGLTGVGRLVHSLAKWRVITIPVIVVIGAFGLWKATEVTSGFEIEDFLSSETDFAHSIDLAGQYFPSSGEGSSFVFVEGDLLDPENLEAIDDIVADIDVSSATFGRNAAGELSTTLHAADLVRMTMDSPAVTQIEAAGHDLRDLDDNGIPDTRDGVAAIFAHIALNGVPRPDGSTAVTRDTVPEIYADDGRVQSTAVVVQMASFTNADVIVPAQEALEAAAARYEDDNTNVTASVAGEVLTQFVSMESFTRSMLVSLPLALLLTFLIASAMLRSIRYALVSVLPIGLVVIGVYAFMATFGYTVNVVTATIAAIAVGVGIDFSTHFTARFREELAHRGDKLAAVRAAGTGTGGALVLSAITSVLGFAIMGMAPTPIFATFGVLTAVMIVLSLAVAILVLPSLLVAVTSNQPTIDSERDTQQQERQPSAVI
jgi:predicted RND superfamily exporter protein